MNKEYPSLLPNSLTKLERDYEQTIFTALDIADEFNFADIWDPYKCPENMLNWLAWHRHADVYDESWPENKKRDVIASSPIVHKRKGTVKSVLLAIESAGFGRATLEEQSSTWAKYKIALSQQLSNAQTKNVQNIIREVVSARNELEGFTYEVLVKWNGKIKFNGNYRWGGA